MKASASGRAGKDLIHSSDEASRLSEPREIPACLLDFCALRSRRGGVELARGQHLDFFFPRKLCAYLKTNVSSIEATNTRPCGSLKRSMEPHRQVVVLFRRKNKNGRAPIRTEG